MQPGPRNYDRSFIRDGSATAAVLLRMGLASIAREYLRWYADHAVHENGLVSPILNDDGTINRGFGSDLEYDSQGELVALVAEVARLDGGGANAGGQFAEGAAGACGSAAAAGTHARAGLHGCERSAGTISRHHRPLDQP